jgi:hypothetical protein
MHFWGVRLLRVSVFALGDASLPKMSILRGCVFAGNARPWGVRLLRVPVFALGGCVFAGNVRPQRGASLPEMPVLGGCVC